MRYLDIEKFRNADLQVDPFQYIVAHGILCADRLNEINSDFPDIKKAGHFRIQDLKYGAHFKTFIEEIASPVFREVIEEKFNADLRDLDQLVSVCAFSQKTDGNIHTDAPAKIITALIYLNEDWSSAGGCLRLLRNAYDIDDYIAEVPPVSGTLLMFKRSDNSWHGHKPFVGPRRTVQVNWVTDAAGASKQYRPVTLKRKVKQWLGLEA